MAIDVTRSRTSATFDEVGASSSCWSSPATGRHGQGRAKLIAVEVGQGVDGDRPATPAGSRSSACSLGDKVKRARWCWCSSGKGAAAARHG